MPDRFSTVLPAPSRSGRIDAVLCLMRRARRRAAVRIAVLAVVLALVAVAAMMIGPVPIAPTHVIGILVDHVSGARAGHWSASADEIVWGTRAPRVVMGIIAGAVLAVAGAVLQALVRNSLADPYLLGINSGASTGVALVVLVIGSGSALVFSGAALAGAIGAVLLVVALAGTASRRGPLRLVLAGLAVGYALNAATSFLVFWSDSPEAARSVLFWLLGSLTSVQPIALAAAAITGGVGLVALVVIAPFIDALASGDDSARSAGIDPERARLGLMVAVSAMVGVIVAAVGGVGFIGLVVPHLARRLVGGRHRAVLPVSALLGGSLLVIADTVARIAFAPQEIPVGVVTGVLGAPFLLVLLRRTAPATAP
ncbi:iron ABC transporter permease [Curtobacterium flaccumfaciens pv. flaccumfaciens]|uniref:FecCD family ABC transporter permease n=1 Tax=Curtobacterium TaxID=2034 RepID=UPI0005ACFF5B|nr:iron ABC transporter permease [Curtobacterium flaccumfaciens]KIQ09910.1 ABC transporter permease [Curtobacterium flaccumfaciens]MCS6564803.1 iron ABC transporter permease [Curtobacterium flaccumfaciens pv. flaccumfaciens]